MLKVDTDTLDRMEAQHPGIRGTILRFDAADLPGCPRCGSEDTADVHCGIVGRTIYVAAATTKFKLLANGPLLGEFFCNDCNKHFD